MHDGVGDGVFDGDRAGECDAVVFEQVGCGADL